MSLFITFEGGEGCGKSVQAKALYRRLLRLAVPVILTQEPGGTSLSRRIGRWLKWANARISPLAELLLFNASRVQLVTEVIRPALKDGEVVLCDRWADSTTAYQSYGRQLDLAAVKRINNIGTQGLKPDLTILIDVPVETGLARKKPKKPSKKHKRENKFNIQCRPPRLEEPKVPWWVYIPWWWWFISPWTPIPDPV